MNELKQYKIVYTEAAEEDIFSKAEYIEKAYHDSDLAFKWYTRLRSQIQKDLSFYIVLNEDGTKSRKSTHYSSKAEGRNR